MRKILVVLLVLCVPLAAGLDVFLGPLLYTLTPIQRHYLGAYLASSWHGSDPTATTEIRWVWKFRPEAEPSRKGAKKAAPQLQYEMAHEGDVLPIPASELLWKGDVLPFWMTRKAELDGWAGIEQGLPTQMNSAMLAALLRQDFFEGEPAWRFFVQPALLLVLGCLLLWVIQRWLAGRRERHWWRVRPVPLWRELGQKVLASGADLRRSLAARPEPLAFPAATPARTIEAKSAIKPTPKAKPADSSQVVSQVSVPAPTVKKPKVQGTFWDETKGLE
jgi:hypothetical protein